MLTDWLSENIVEIFGAVTGIAYVILEIRRNIWLWPLGIIASAVYIYVFGRNGFYANMGLQGYYLVISFYGWYVWYRAQGKNSIIARDGANDMENEVARSGAKDLENGVARSGAKDLENGVARSGVKDGENGVARNGAKDIENGVARSGVKDGENGVARRASSIVELVDSPSSLPPDNPESIGEALKQAGTDILRIDRVTAAWCVLAAAALWAGLWLLLDRATDSPVPVWDGLIASMSVVATWMLTRKYLEQWYVWIVANAIATVVYLASGLYPTAVLFFVYFVMAIVGVRAWSGSRQ